MIDHTGISTPDFDAATRFYNAVMSALGGGKRATIPTHLTDGAQVVGYGRDRAVFWLSEGDAQKPPVHIAFSAENRAMVERFHQAALGAGGVDNGAPGLRPHYHEHYYGAFVLDPDGNNIEAVCHAPPKT